MFRFNVVLIRPIYPRNIGMCLRALANMGGGQVILIAPLGDPHSDEAKQGAAGANAVAIPLKIYDSFDSFYSHETEGVRFAFSARTSRLRETADLNKKLQELARKNAMLTDPEVPLYLFFGPEDDGLSASDMELVHHVCSLPTYGEFTSLNLSHAVLLALYVFRTFLEAIPPVAFNSTIPGSTASRKPMYYPKQSIEVWLELLGFDLTAPKINIAKTLHRLLLENEPSQDDLRLLDTVLQQTIRKLKSR